MNILPLACNWYARALVVAGRKFPEMHMNDFTRFLSYMGYHQDYKRGSHSRWVNGRHSIRFVEKDNKISGDIIEKSLKQWKQYMGVSSNEFREWIRTGKIKRIEEERKPAPVEATVPRIFPVLYEPTERDMLRVKEWSEAGFLEEDVAKEVMLPTEIVRQIRERMRVGVPAWS